MRGNGMGPENGGPQTGRGLGFCAGYDAPGFASGEAPMGMRRGFGAGFGRGRGRAMRFGRGFGWGPARGTGPRGAETPRGRWVWHGF